ncbi:MAG: hypothetical protein ACJA1H_002010 [Glaciecola sp.]|jgi:hypothetical protein
MKFAIIKERKSPPDRRVVFSPEKLAEARAQFPQAEFVVESSDIRVFSDGLSFVYNGSNYSISGAPTEFGVYDFTLQTTSPCDVKTADGTITVDEAPAAIINNTIDLICFGDSSVLMDLSLSVSATSGTWSTTGSGSFTGDTYNFGATETEILTLTFISNTPSGSCDPAIVTYDLEITPFHFIRFKAINYLYYNC